MRLILILIVAGTVVLAGTAGKTIALSVTEYSHVHEVEKHAHEDSHDHHHDEAPAEPSKDAEHHHTHEITVNASYVVAALASVSVINLPELISNDPIKGSAANSPKPRALSSIFRPPIA